VSPETSIDCQFWKRIELPNAAAADKNLNDKAIVFARPARLWGRWTSENLDACWHVLERGANSGHVV
jgi:hypothetical protein